MTTYSIKNHLEVSEFFIEEKNNFNLKNLSLHKNIQEYIDQAEVDDKVRALILTGVENAFHVGDDLESVKVFFKANISRCLDSVINLYLKLLDCRKPIVIAPLGNVTGIGFPLSLLCDRCVAGSTTKFFMPELIHGIGSVLGSTIIEYVLGYPLSKEILYSGKSITGSNLIQNKIANIFVENASHNLFKQEVYCEARRIGELSNLAFMNTKQTLSKNISNQLSQIASYAKHAHNTSSK